LKIPTIAPKTNFVAIHWFAWTIFTLQMTVAALKTSSAPISVLVAFVVTFILLTISNQMQATRSWSRPVVGLEF
jgi:succinate-acetate transporter protein